MIFSLSRSLIAFCLEGFTPHSQGLCISRDPWCISLILKVFHYLFTCPVFCALLNLLPPFKSALHFHLMLMKNVSRPIWKIKVLNKPEKQIKWGIFYYKEEKKNGTNSSIFDNNMIWFHINGNILSLFYIHFYQVYCTYRSWMLSCLSVIKELLLGYLEREKRRLALFVPHQYPKHTPNIIMKSKWYLSAIISVCNSSTSILLLYHPSFNLVVALRNAE